MGHHRRGRPSRRQDEVRGGQGAHRAEEQPEPAPTPAPTPKPTPTPAPRRSGGVTGRGLGELADAARSARRTGWPFGAELLATVDTRGVPATTPPPRDGRPRRYATHQPTAPLEVVSVPESEVTGERKP